MVCTKRGRISRELPLPPPTRSLLVLGDWKWPDVAKRSVGPVKDTVTRSVPTP